MADIQEAQPLLRASPLATASGRTASNNGVGDADGCDPWYAAWATTIAGETGTHAHVGVEAVPGAPAMPRDIAPMVLHMLAGGFLDAPRDALILSLSNVEMHPNWWRAMSLFAHQVHALPLAVQRMPRLRRLYCHGDPGDQFHVFVQACVEIPHLTDLYIKASRGVPRRLSVGVAALALCTRLRRVCLNGCGVTSEDLEAVLGSLPRLQHLDLSNCGNVTTLACVARCTALTSLVISHDDTNGLSSVEGLAQLPALTSVTLSGCMTLMDVEELARCTGLTTLCLSGSTAIVAVDHVLAQLVRLTSVDLAWMSCVSWDTLVVLSQLPCVKQLDLRGCSLRWQTARLGPFPCLTRLRADEPRWTARNLRRAIPTLLYFNDTSLTAPLTATSVRQPRNWLKEALQAIIGILLGLGAAAGLCALFCIFVFLPGLASCLNRLGAGLAPDTHAPSLR